MDRIDDVEVVATHLDHEEVLRDVVPRERDRVAVAGGETHAVGLGLVQPIRIETPEAAVLLLELRRVHPLCAELPVRSAVDVVGRADLDEHASPVVEGECLGVVVLLGRQAGDDGLDVAGGNELARGVPVAIDRRAAGVIEPAVVKGDVGAAVAGAELLDRVGTAVAVDITEGEDGAELAFDVEVAVRRDGQAAKRFGVAADPAAGDHVVSHHEGAESWRQRDGAVVRIGNRQRRRRR